MRVDSDACPCRTVTGRLAIRASVLSIRVYAKKLGVYQRIDPREVMPRPALARAVHAGGDVGEVPDELEHHALAGAVVDRELDRKLQLR